MVETAVKIDDRTAANAQEWLDGDYDAETKAEIRRLQRDDPQGLINAFYQKLAFGTGGLRGLMGVGSNRLNIYTVRAATQGLANYLRAQGEQQPKVLIGHDSREHSAEFARETARVLAANGIEALLYKELRPVPLVSFGCRYLGCNAAVMITASHNPPEYNGYKVYWSDGAQVLPPHDVGIVEEVGKITDLSHVKLVPLDNPHVQWIESQVDEAYLEITHKLQTLPEQNRARGHELKIVYTALHGAGITMVPKTLASWGFTSVVGVEKQNIPDGRFPTVSHPNPEEPEALSLGIKTLNDVQGDILIATDPDTDRMGVVVRHSGTIKALNGNQIASLCVAHLCHQLPIDQRSAFVKTIVTTELFKRIAEDHGARCFDVLTGFKYIGQLIDEWEENGSYQFLFGAEESYGYLRGTHARDKDAIIAAVLISELALDAKLKGETLIDRLNGLYLKYGVHREQLVSLVYEGKEGAEKIQGIMTALRASNPTELDGTQILIAEDYLSGVSHNLVADSQSPLNLPLSDVLLYRLEDGSKVVIRPSGTEPKIKLYCGVVSNDFSTIDEGVAAAEHRAAALLESLQRLF